MTKELGTLAVDIYDLFDSKKEHNIDKGNLSKFLKTMEDLVHRRLSKQEPRKPELYFSSIGKKDRQLWLAHKGYVGEDISPKTLFKFMYGDVLEALILFLAAEAGHKVEREQERVSVLGVRGKIDAFIDGILVDVKSASPHGYKKFKDGKVTEDDPFGYIPQICGYSNELTPGVGPAFVAFDKVGGDICVSPVPVSIANDHKPEVRIKHLKKVLASDVMPPQCYPEEPDGKSGNMKLATGCSYCSLKEHCFPSLRTFIYSTGPRFLTKVVKTPDVYEVR